MAGHFQNDQRGATVLGVGLEAIDRAFVKNEVAFFVDAVMQSDRGADNGVVKLYGVAHARVLKPRQVMGVVKPRVPVVCHVAFTGEGAAVERRLQVWAEFQQHIRSEEHTSELQSLMRISYAVFCLKKKK